MFIMSCYYHNQVESVAQCTDCGKALCKSCASHYEIPLCRECAIHRNDNLKDLAFKNLGYLGIGVVVGIIIMIFQLKMGIFSFNGVGDWIIGIIAYIVLGIAVVAIPVGWKSLNKITPSFFIWLPFIGWVFYFVIKLCLSFVVGLFVLPVKTVKGIVQYSKAKKNQNFINEKYR
jgi:hypothetical protein